MEWIMEAADKIERVRKRSNDQTYSIQIIV